MSASLQQAVTRAPVMSALSQALRPASLRPSTAATLTSSSLRLASTYRNPNDPNADDNAGGEVHVGGGGRPSLPQQKYKNKKVWPPDFTRLSPQEQLRFEKRYKRRVALASARPRWVKFVKLVQLFSITFVVIYGVLFMEWDYGPQPFVGIREWFWNTLGLLRGGQNSTVRKANEDSKDNVASEK
ncbi:hypothetical protein Sste5346_001969 [Sporothrix stenoceras]|uniref:Uncharacterized protein n=1 Tax=Sporothrix stenoceras TaxID=5173 RepID=A0ABR3ZJL7_9PEZI